MEFIRKMKTMFLAGGCCNRSRGNHFKLKESRFRLEEIWDFFFARKVVQHWNIAQRSSRKLIAGNNPGQTGWGSEQSDVAEGVTANSTCVM